MENTNVIMKYGVTLDRMDYDGEFSAGDNSSDDDSEHNSKVTRTRDDDENSVTNMCSSTNSPESEDRFELGNPSISRVYHSSSDEYEGGTDVDVGVKFSPLTSQSNNFRERPLDNVSFPRAFTRNEALKEEPREMKTFETKRHTSTEGMLPRNFPIMPSRSTMASAMNNNNNDIASGSSNETKGCISAASMNSKSIGARLSSPLSPSDVSLELAATSSTNAVEAVHASCLKASSSSGCSNSKMNNPTSARRQYGSNRGDNSGSGASISRGNGEHRYDPDTRRLRRKVKKEKKGTESTVPETTANSLDVDIDTIVARICNTSPPPSSKRKKQPSAQPPAQQQQQKKKTKTTTKSTSSKGVKEKEMPKVAAALEAAPVVESCSEKERKEPSAPQTSQPESEKSESVCSISSPVQPPVSISVSITTTITTTNTTVSAASAATDVSSSTLNSTQPTPASAPTSVSQRKISCDSISSEVAQGFVTFTDFESLSSPNEDCFQVVTSRKEKVRKTPPAPVKPSQAQNPYSFKSSGKPPQRPQSMSEAPRGMAATNAPPASYPRRYPPTSAPSPTVAPRNVVSLKTAQVVSGRNSSRPAFTSGSNTPGNAGHVRPSPPPPPPLSVVPPGDTAAKVPVSPLNKESTQSTEVFIDLSTESAYPPLPTAAPLTNGEGKKNPVSMNKPMTPTTRTEVITKTSMPPQIPPSVSSANVTATDLISPPPPVCPKIFHLPSVAFLERKWQHFLHEFEGVEGSQPESVGTF